MKNNKWNLITALSDSAASISLAFAAALQAEISSQLLFSIAASGFLIGGIGFFCTYVKNKKASNK